MSKTNKDGSPRKKPGPKPKIEEEEQTLPQAPTDVTPPSAEGGSGEEKQGEEVSADGKTRETDLGGEPANIESSETPEGDIALSGASVPSQEVSEPEKDQSESGDTPPPDPEIEEEEASTPITEEKDLDREREELDKEAVAGSANRKKAVEDGQKLQIKGFNTMVKRAEKFLKARNPIQGRKFTLFFRGNLSAIIEDEDHNVAGKIFREKMFAYNSSLLTAMRKDETMLLLLEEGIQGLRRVQKERKDAADSAKE